MLLISNNTNKSFYNVGKTNAIFFNKTKITILKLFI